MIYCSGCGTALKDGAKFCPVCGAAVPTPTPDPTPTAPVVPAVPAPPAKKTAWPLFLAIGAAAMALIVALLALLGVIRFGGAGGRVEGKGFSTPEKAMEAYADAFAKHDVDGMLSTFAIETRAEKGDYAASMWRIRAYTPQSSIYFNGNAYGQDLTEEYWRRVVTDELLKEYKIVAARKNGLDDEKFFVYSQVLDSEEDAEDFAAYFNDDSLFRSVKLIKILDADDVFDAEGTDNRLEIPQIRKNQQQMQDIIGAEDWNEGCMELEIDGDRYWLFLYQVKYNGKWYNADYHGILPSILGIDMNHALTPLD